ncbi:MAG: leucine-rich repeat protein, partial [Bacteroidales bacterium]|nr:leucine-rich repeat protein [Bacteroidales bacterium]
MKRLLFILMCLSAIFAGRAQTFAVGDLTYTVTVAENLEVSVKTNNPAIEGDVIIPESVTYQDIQYSVTSIGFEAFRGSGITSITIPKTVTSIKNYAFWDCTELTSITIPCSVTSIGERVFFGCINLTNIEVDENNSQYCSVDGVLFNKEKTEIFTFPAGSKVSEYVIPNSVTSIGNYAFIGCSELTSITIPNSVTAIGYAAFGICKGLTSIIIPNSVTSIDEWAFAYCEGLTSVTIPNSVTSIRDEAFYGCTGLSSITIPNSVTSIGNNAFYGCSYLSSITIPNSVTSIGNNAFSWSGIRNISINNPEPPTVEGGTFDTWYELTISVPTNLVETYKAAEGWKDLNIVGVVPKNLANGTSTTALNFDANTFAGIQFDVECPAGVELSVCDEAAAQMTISKSEIPGGKTRYIAYTNNGEALTAEFIVMATATEAERGTLKISNIITSVNDVPVGISDVEIPVLGYALEGLSVADVYEGSETALATPAELETIEDLSIAWMPYSSDFGTLTEDGLFTASAEGTITDLPLQINDPLVLAPLDATAILKIMMLMGDVNRSGAIDIADVVSVVNDILMRDPDPFDFKRADLDGSGDINIADLTRLVKLVLAQPKAVAAHSRMRVRAAEGEMHLSVIPTGASADGKRHVYVHLDTDREYTAMQVDLETTGGARIESIHAGTGIDSHVMDHAVIDPTTTRVLLYSHSLAALPAGEHIIDVTIADSNADASPDAELIATSAVSADADGQAYNHAEASAYIGDIPTGINGAYSETMSITTAPGQIFVTSPADATVSVIDLQG